MNPIVVFSSSTTLPFYHLFPKVGVGCEPKQVQSELFILIQSTIISLQTPRGEGHFRPRTV